ncbi:hypothetical protein [Thermomonas sp. HDW16]|uniref:hypothetical protein n=1 Tax=Thermomonas sp. HDW16 TaxID=2714945 RepID=UPI001407DC62|nr:hypothetical protein [Thermomonas sp. HDW16]QIL20526.1 hypothetical protein G7079_07150 [Thermomonas sp. HDW16]
MNQPDTQVTSTPSQETTKGKRTYLKPAFEYESVFETMALACGKIRGQVQDQCRRVLSNS